jgi:hypothetical protein
MVNARSSIATSLPIAVVVAVTLAGAPTHGQNLDLFVAAERCVACHNGLVTPAGEDISIGSDWRPSMMANAARDPYWQAGVRREILVRPEIADAIQNECSACHMPMTRFAAKAAGLHGGVFAHLPAVRAVDPADRLAVDGVSCAVCHQIGAEGLGERDSFTAGFVVDTATSPGGRTIFGPYEVDSGRQSLMRSAAGFVPEQADHIQSSEMCATCHTLITHALDDDGKVIADFPEQVPYLEWKHSAYASDRKKSCQSCHMPEVEGDAPIAGVLGRPREEVSRHVFRGGNFFMPRIFKRYRGELGVESLPQELETMSARTAAHLASSAAVLKVENVERTRDRLRAEAVIENLAGHKLPSAYPSRRAWIHFTVRDRKGAVVFESGRLEPDGSIVGNDNDADAGRYEPHHAVIESPGQVQIYEPIMAGPEGTVTTVLLTAVQYLKDNRILPDGFEKATAAKEIAVHGKATTDPDFVGGGDRVRFDVAIADAEGPFTVEAELWYQPIGHRWAHNLAQEQAPEIDFFVSAYEALAPQSATLLASDRIITD